MLAILKSFWRKGEDHPSPAPDKDMPANSKSEDRPPPVPSKDRDKPVDRKREVHPPTVPDKDKPVKSKSNSKDRPPPVPAKDKPANSKTTKSGWLLPNTLSVHDAAVFGSSTMRLVQDAGTRARMRD